MGIDNLSPEQKTRITLDVFFGTLGLFVGIGGGLVLYNTGSVDFMLIKQPEKLPPYDPIYKQVAESTYNTEFGFDGVIKRGTLVVVSTNPKTSEVTFLTANHVVTENYRNAYYASIGGIRVENPSVVQPDTELDIALVTMKFKNPQDFKKFIPIPNSLLREVPNISHKQNEVGVPAKGYKSDVIVLDSPVSRIQYESIDKTKKLIFNQVLPEGSSGSMVIDNYENGFLITGIVTQAATHNGTEYTVVTPLSKKVLDAVNQKR